MLPFFYSLRNQFFNLIHMQKEKTVRSSDHRFFTLSIEIASHLKNLENKNEKWQHGSLNEVMETEVTIIVAPDTEQEIASTVSNNT